MALMTTAPTGRLLPHLHHPLWALPRPRGSALPEVMLHTCVLSSSPVQITFHVFVLLTIEYSILFDVSCVLFLLFISPMLLRMSLLPQVRRRICIIGPLVIVRMRL